MYFAYQKSTLSDLLWCFFRQTFFCQFASVNLRTTILPVQKLGEEPSDKHRQTCSEATKPLLDAVEELTVFASPAKFTSTPAKISKEGQHTQQPIIEVSYHSVIKLQSHFNMLNFTLLLQINSVAPRDA